MERPAESPMSKEAFRPLNSTFEKKLDISILQKGSSLNDSEVGHSVQDFENNLTR